MKNGFTLIELLAVIAILVIILIIAIPQILNMVENSKIDAYVSTNKLVLKSAQLYVANNNNILQINIGETIKVDLSTLISEGYSTQIVNPNNSEEICNGYVLITKINDVDFDYNSHVICGYDDDTYGLVLHYKFNDFQEPTQNLITAPYIGEGTHETFSTFNFQRTINKAVMSSEEYTISGEFWRNHYHEGRIYSMFYLQDSSGVMIPGNAGLIPNWAATVAEPLYRYFNNNIRSTAIGNWYHYALPKITIPTGYDDGQISWIRVMLTSGATDLDVTKFRNIQFEQKGYSTPFVNGTRQGTITDYSNNNTTASLALNTTPRWIGENNNGYYQFDGLKTSISLPNDLVPVNKIRTDGITYSAWIKPNEIKLQRILGQQISSGYSDYSSGGLGMNELGQVQMIAYSDANPSSYVRATSNTILNTSNWYHIVGTYNPNDNQIRIYVNGNLDGNTESIGTFSRLLSNTSNRIGNKDHLSTPYYYSGLIDEVRIYERNLTDSEIKVLYKLGR